MKLVDLLTAVPHYDIVDAPSYVDKYPDGSINITNITTDSRQVDPGALFVAYLGVNLDIHHFIPEAINRGAAVIVGENEELIHSLLTTTVSPPPCIIVPNGREALAYLAAAWYHFPAHQLTMIGITGTDGKTTTTHFLHQILRAAHKKLGTINTVSAVIDGEAIETGLQTTTPKAPDLQHYLARMVKADIKYCLLEVTSHGLSQHRVTACDFDVAIVTNITHEHLDEHGSLEKYRAAKATLFESLATATDKGQPKTAVLNCDDWSFAYLKAKLAVTNIRWVGYSLTNHPEANVIATNISYRPDRTCFTIQKKKQQKFEVETTLVGDYNVSNCLAAVTAALEVLRIPWQSIQQGVAALSGVPGRMERIDEGQPFVAIVDFAHTPNSLRRSLTTAQTLTSGRVIAVFGCAGLRDVEKRAMMGHIAAELADITIITAEDPRTEDLNGIIDETARAMLAKGAVEGATFERVPDRGRAIYRAIQLAQPDDVVIALGKGHEQSMCFGETEYAWDDREAMRAVLRGRPLLALPSA